MKKMTRNSRRRKKIKIIPQYWRNDAQFEIDNQHIENHKQDEGDLSDFKDIFELKRQEDNKEDQDVHLDNLAEFLDGFDDDELENFL